MLMSTVPQSSAWFPGLGVASLVLGMLGLLFFFMPIFGIPISALGLVVALVACVRGWSGRGARSPFALAGLFVCLTALVVNVAVSGGPRGRFYDHDTPVSRELGPSPEPKTVRP
jgi:hypothetical protein